MAELIEDHPTAPSRRRSRRLRHVSLGVGAVVVAGAGAFVWSQAKPMIESRKYASIVYEVPDAPQLTAQTGETVYRIDPTQSSLTYEIDEKLGGAKTSTATGLTNGIAGDIAVNSDDLSKSRLGQIVVNIEQFHSDNNLRDARLRQDFLSSNRYPLATFDITEIDGLAGPLTEGQTYEFTMSGNVVVKDIGAPAIFEATASVEDGKLTATASTTAKLSRFDAGPISIAGLVTTSDDVKLTLELTAVDPSRYDIPTEITGPDAIEVVEKVASDEVSFRNDVMPILESNCVSCHNSGEMAAHTLVLDTAGDVAEVSDGIKTVTQARYMPPWPASDVGVELAHDPRLSEAQLDILARWSDGGGKLDLEPETEIRPSPTAAAAIPRRDQSLRIPAYLGSAANPNDYRCFVLEPELTEPTFLTGYTFLADQIQQLHHAQVFHISDEQRANAAELENQDGQPGWTCYTTPNLRGRDPGSDPLRPRDQGFAGQNNLVAGWVPGQSPVIFPLNSGVLMQPGDALILQIHYHYGSGVVPDESGLALQLDADDGELRKVRVVNPLAPVEIPCKPADQHRPLCDRAASMAYNQELYGANVAANGLHMMCGSSPGQVAASFDGSVARSSCDQVVPEDGTIIGVMGHMHTIGKDLRITLDPDSPDERILLDIPEWSFDWQMNYELAAPLKVKAGQPIRIECRFDRDLDPLREPRYIAFAEGTEDEMCFGTYSLIPDHRTR